MKAADQLMEVYRSSTDNKHIDVHTKTIAALKNQFIHLSYDIEEQKMSFDMSFRCQIFSFNPLLILPFMIRLCLFIIYLPIFTYYMYFHER